MIKSRRIREKQTATGNENFMVGGKLLLHGGFVVLAHLQGRPAEFFYCTKRN